eukprot:CAMPEP_0119010538 /NCGR_PEP_ID=MMETSP1176-20130426/5078_1 /TAXON_ID=265551 /ORGANISM="Synedropsis recta cf, Strain CCMP1620" /LENGTH=224 /DNA_ID=CAMNT_0006963213 /DNA_START=86 /DNA_END=760 /DNA_ORIENTATION=+
MRVVQQPLPLLVLIGVLTLKACAAWSPSSSPMLSRKDMLKSSGAAAAVATAFLINHSPPAFAFDGSGSSAYVGRKARSKEELTTEYKARVVQDVKDFNTLGAAIDRGETEGDDWVGFFIQYQRREPDELGRTYAARLDLIGEDGLGGVGLLLAGTFAKKGKPIDGLPQVKKFNAVAKTLMPIKKAAKSGDAAKAKKEWLKASVALSEYLQAVDLPESLADPIYN